MEMITYTNTVTTATEITETLLLLLVALALLVVFQVPLVLLPTEQCEIYMNALRDKNPKTYK